MSEEEKIEVILNPEHKLRITMPYSAIVQLLWFLRKIVDAGLFYFEELENFNIIVEAIKEACGRVEIETTEADDLIEHIEKAIDN